MHPPGRTSAMLRRGSRRLRATLRPAGVIAVLCAVSACQTSSEVSLRTTPHTLIYTYLMAHGMARGTVMSGDMTPQKLSGLLIADRAALLAVMKETAYPSGSNLAAASQAVQQLLAMTQPSDYGAPRPPPSDP
ncbi:hypothetical protein [Acetobacter oeni]|uniref:Uncharacterized protein n=2 Tax=Acetobacter oeni TaxID=304077 RepID=A0A511XIF8_9PROT|nr:hypothetical protein [Acetobacter oeni]GEN62729.1 hypothetical protein AOE01nite_09530 [Acetobacter oeni]